MQNTYETDFEPFLSDDTDDAVPVHLVSKDMAKDLSKQVSSFAAHWAENAGFSGERGEHLCVAGEDGGLAAVLFGLGDGDSDDLPMVHGDLARKLPEGSYRLTGKIIDPDLAALGWLLGAYEFGRYRDTRKNAPCLALVKGADMTAVKRAAQASYLARDLINTPASDMGPDDIETAFRGVAEVRKADVSVVSGDDLLERNFPMIHAVGRASNDAPRLLDMVWGDENHPKVTLVGKGVAFDTGGLNIKPGSSMALMKKDMGGAANVLALAQMIIDARLPVRLRVLVPAVENSISGNAFRPGDVLDTRKGITVEIGNTDAEGRLVLGDALTLGDEEEPHIMIDMATLTGAARVALGPDLPPFYTDDDGFAEELSAASRSESDPLWRMPLWKPYNALMSSKVADVNHINTSGTGFAGSVTAALFLSRFVEKAESWTHLDIFGWTPIAKPWAPIGGEAQGIRALFRVLEQRFPPS